MTQERELGRLFVITGSPGTGKTTVGRALAQALSRAVFIDGDTVGDLVVTGREPMTNPPTEGAIEQLMFRYAGALVLADTYRAAGFDAVIADTVYDRYFEDFLEIAAPETLHLVVLHPSAEAVRRRGASSDGTDDGFTVGGLWSSVEYDTPRIGLWIDSSEHTVADTVLEIIQRQHQSVVPTDHLAPE